MEFFAQSQQDLISFSNESRLQQALRLGGLGLWNYRPADDVSFWSDEMFRIYGLIPKSGPVCLKDVLQRVHIDDRHIVREGLLKATTGSYDVTFRITLPSGEERVVQSLAVDNDVLRNHGFVYGITRDITEQSQLEGNFRRNRKGLEQAVRIAELGHWEWHIRTNQVILSDEMYRIYGLTESGGPATRAALLSLTHPDDVEQVQRTVKRSMAALLPYEHEYRIIRGDGTVRYLHVRGEIEQSSGHGPEKLHGTVQDITERKEQARRLAESEQRYASLLNYNPDGICTVDLDGRILGGNPAFERITGYQDNELSDISFCDLLISDNPDLVNGLCTQAVQGQVVSNVELVLEHKSSNHIHVLCTAVPIVIEDEIQGVYAIVRDITEERNMKAQLHSVFKTVTDAIVVINCNGMILSWNTGAEHLFGYFAHEVLGQTLDIVIPERFREAHHQGMERVRTTRVPRIMGKSVEFTGLRNDGLEIPIEISITSFGEGSGLCFTAIVRDITERKRTEDLLLKSEKLTAVGQLAAGVAHEIRNPLTALKGFNQLLESGYVPEKKEYFQIMRNELTRIESILDELLMLAKPQVVNMQPRDVRLIIHDVVTLLSSQANLHNVMILCELNVDVPVVECEENQLKQVFVNVIKNAIEAMSRGGTLTIRLETEPEHVVLRFVDEGDGMPAERIVKLGEPFYTTKERGTGMGLMVCYRIIEAHKGLIEITSEVGRGTEVCVTLPLNLER